MEMTEINNSSKILDELFKIKSLKYSIFTLSPEVSRFKSMNNKSQLYHTDIHV